MQLYVNILDIIIKNKMSHFIIFQLLMIFQASKTVHTLIMGLNIWTLFLKCLIF